VDATGAVGSTEADATTAGGVVSVIDRLNDAGAQMRAFSPDDSFAAARTWLEHHRPGHASKREQQPLSED